MINKKELEILNKELNFFPSDETIEKLNQWKKIFVEYNSHTNLMSKGDMEVLFEKHVFDSLSIVKWEEFKNHNKILDVGCGGGFPSVILAICFPNKTIIANDSRIKKINFIKEIKEKLNLDNLEVCYSRIEEVEELNVDLIVSRAVGKMIDVWELSKKHLVKNGTFLIYKAKLLNEEIEAFKKKYQKAKFEIIPYNLPLEETFERSLVVLK
ncbi:MAG: 16S rRNA (guanine(527)-N(7))-methyltransferase RsmG [Candidatus Gastranaerophilales bacterium]|nr:16S rRNA (guanine(527)-N(7))-methyltransferase RsmG [Candidatus Gastranaerophilales bacterium]